MSIWGTGILDNDLAADLKDQWNELLSEGYEPEDISDSMIADAVDELMLGDIEDQYDFFLPFALIQWKTGRLQSNVKEMALELLNEETIDKIEKNRWEEQKDLRKRMQNLSKLRSILDSGQPPPKKIRKPYKQVTNLRGGDLISILLNSGNYVLLDVIDIQDSHGWQIPICVLYRYLSPILPNSELTDGLEVVNFSSKGLTGSFTNIELGSINKKQAEPKDRIIIIEQNRNTKFISKTPRRLCWWNQIDSQLEEWITKNAS